MGKPHGSELCGLRPTGRLHIGHYFSVIKPGRSGVTVLIANYHAPGKEHTEETVETLKRFGVENIVIQTDAFDADMYFKLLSISRIGDLGRMTQYKSAAEEDRNGHLLTYPVLMAHDVAGYKKVLVGEDQTQHLQYARKVLRRYNEKFDENVEIPEEKIVVGRIKDLKRPENKMSKSSPSGCLFLDDSPEEMRRKIRKATMDESGIESLAFLYKEFVGPTVPSMNSKLKEELTEALVAQLE